MEEKKVVVLAEGFAAIEAPVGCVAHAEQICKWWYKIKTSIDVLINMSMNLEIKKENGHEVF